MKDSYERTIFAEIEHISTMSLLDKELALSKRWQPDDFVAEMDTAIGARETTIARKFHLIESMIEDIGNLLIIWPKELKKKTRLSLGDLVRAEPKLNELKAFYSRRLYAAVAASVEDAIGQLVDSCSYDLHVAPSSPPGENYYATQQQQQQQQQQQAFAAAGLSGFVDPSDSLSIVSPLEMQNQSTLMNTTNPNNPNNNNDAILWTHEPSQEDDAASSMTASGSGAAANAALVATVVKLKLEFGLKYTIPEVTTLPSFDHCGTSVKHVTKRLVETSKGTQNTNPDQKYFCEKIHFWPIS